MTHGLSPRTVATIHAILARHPEVERAVLYGSRATGMHRPGSDIDLTLLGSGLDARTCGSIAADLDESDIPYMVDLSVFEWLSHAGLREHIARVGQVFYDRARGDATAGR